MRINSIWGPYMRASANVCQDIVSKRLKLIEGEDFVYHVSNNLKEVHSMKDFRSNKKSEEWAE